MNIGYLPSGLLPLYALPTPELLVGMVHGIHEKLLHCALDLGLEECAVWRVVCLYRHCFMNRGVTSPAETARMRRCHVNVRC
jgi:hypothetical protein